MFNKLKEILSSGKSSTATVEVPTGTSKDIVVRPSHYTENKVEPINLIMLNKMSFGSGNAVKYLCRAGKKQYEGMTLEESHKVDLRKAQQYITMELNMIEGKETVNG